MCLCVKKNVCKLIVSIVFKIFPMKNTPLSIKERAAKFAEKWYIIDPLYFLIWTTHEFVLNPLIQTMRTGNGRIEYNPAFVDALSADEFEAILKAELLRIILKHPYTRRLPHTEIVYLASNITIKEYTDTPLNFPSAETFFRTKEANKKHFEWYYHKIIEQAQQNSNNSKDFKNSKSDGKQGSGKGNKSDNSGENTEGGQNEPNQDNQEEQDGQDNSLENYTQPQSGNENTALWDANDWMANTINEKIETAIQNNSWGTIKGNLQELIKASLRPKLDYRRVLRAFRQRVLSSKRTLTRMKPSRRYEFQYMGSRRDFTTKMLFAFDVSGSISSEDLQNALGILNQFFKYGIESIDVVLFDTVIQGKPLTVKRAKNALAVVGRGGTDFSPVMRYINEHRDYDGLVIFTDGYAPQPPPPQNKTTKIMWLFNDEKGYNAMYPNLKHLGKAAFVK
jgi:predicted metal-dependent peptidase